MSSDLVGEFIMLSACLTEKYILLSCFLNHAVSGFSHKPNSILSLTNTLCHKSDAISLLSHNQNVNKRSFAFLP